MTNTAAKTNDAVSPGAVILRTIDNSKQTKSGPHKSPKTTTSNNKGIYEKSTKWLTVSQFLNDTVLIFLTERHQNHLQFVTDLI